jgi:hypothetical protein
MSALKRVVPKPEDVFSYEKNIPGYAALSNGDLLTCAGVDIRLGALFPLHEWTPPYIEYKRLEIPCSPGASDNGREVIPEEFLRIYAEYGTREAYLGTLRTILRRPDMLTTHTDVLCKPTVVETRLPVADVPDPDNPGKKMAVAAFAVQLPMDFPLPFLLGTTPHMVKCLVDNLRRHLKLDSLSESSRLLNYSFLRFAASTGRAGTNDQVLYATLGKRLNYAAEGVVQFTTATAFKRYRELFVKATYEKKMKLARARMEEGEAAATVASRASTDDEDSQGSADSDDDLPPRAKEAEAAPDEKDSQESADSGLPPK